MISQAYEGYKPDVESNPFYVLSLSDLLSREQEPVRWVVDGLVPHEGISIIGADAGIGKTWLVLHLALCVAYGKPFADHFPTAPGRVLVFDAESSESLLTRRVQRLYHGFRCTDWTLDNDAPVSCIPGAFRIDTTYEVDSVVGRIEATQADLVIVDPLVHSLLGPENDAQVIARFFEQVRRIQRKTGVAFVFTHHSRKRSALNPNSADQVLRGSSAIRGVLDSYLYVRKQGGRLLVEHDKCRVAQALPPFTIEIVDTDDSATAVRYIGEAANSSPDKLTEAKGFVTRVLRDAGGSLLRKDIQNMAEGEGISKRTMDRALDELADDGELQKSQEGKAVRYKVWTDWGGTG